MKFNISTIVVSCSSSNTIAGNLQSGEKGVGSQCFHAVIGMKMESPTRALSWRSSQTTTQVQVVPIEQARRDLSNGRTVTSVDPAVDEWRHLLCAELMLKS